MEATLDEGRRECQLWRRGREDEVQELKDELKSHAPAVRQSVEEALRRLSIPEVRVDVQNAQ